MVFVCFTKDLVPSCKVFIVLPLGVVQDDAYAHRPYNQTRTIQYLGQRGNIIIYVYKINKKTIETSEFGIISQA